MIEPDHINNINYYNIYVNYNFVIISEMISALLLEQLMT